MESIIIKAPNLGIGQSPHTGYGNVRNLDISSIPGVVRLNNLLAKKSGSTVTNLIQWLVKDPVTPANIFALDAGGQLYKSTDSGDTWATVAGETAGGAGQGLAIWKGYVFVARTSALDVYSIAGASWTNSWKTIDSDALWHPMIVSDNDGKLYGGAGRYVFSLDEATTFDPSSGATYTWTQQALDLPSNYRIKCLAEQGNNLMCGTWIGSNIYDYKVANIFPWDRSSVSFGQPVKIAEYGVHSMFNDNGVLYIQAGIEGRLYKSNGVQATPCAQIPSSVSSIEGGLYLEPFPGAIMKFKGKIFFGVSGSTSGMGIWSMYETSKGNVLNLEHTISTGNDGTSNALKIGALLDINRDTLLAGWRDNTTYGIDKTTNTSRNTSYAGYFESPFYNIGTPKSKNDLNECELFLAQPLTTGQGVQLKYRTDLSASWTTIKTLDFASLGGIETYFFNPNIQDQDSIQFRVELTTGSSSNTSPQFKQLIFR